jgi:hypothetical protein
MKKISVPAPPQLLAAAITSACFKRGWFNNVVLRADSSTAGKEKNCLKTVPGKGWFIPCFAFTVQRKAVFDQTWIPGDFEKTQKAASNTRFWLLIGQEKD